MNANWIRIGFVTLCAGSVLTLGWAQDTKPKTGGAPTPAGKTSADAGKSGAEMKPATATADHAALKQFEGTWDAKVEMRMTPDAAPTLSSGTEINRMSFNGLWLIGDFKGEFMGKPFEGHSVMGYDLNKKKYLGTWIDSMNSALATSEGSYDKSTRTFTAQGESTDPDGKPCKGRHVTQFKDDNTFVTTMYKISPDGTEFPAMTITYKRASGATSRG